jgi:hypothetical protein
VGQNNSHSYNTPYFATPRASSYDYNISANANTNYYYQWENFANYNLVLGKHNVTAMAGMSYTENNVDNVSGSATGPDILTGYDPNFRYLDYAKSNVVSGTEKTIKITGFYNSPSVQIADKLFLMYIALIQVITRAIL